ncbi:hypothetical protein I3843_15G133500 [Carya illinoinensis]|nr:hypothetical protein I3843_15G133500 [Carya illinoinensis]
MIMQSLGGQPWRIPIETKPNNFQMPKLKVCKIKCENPAMEETEREENHLQSLEDCSDGEGGGEIVTTPNCPEQEPRDKREKIKFGDVQSMHKYGDLLYKPETQTPF